MEEHESKGDFGGVKTSSKFVEFPRSLNLEHEVATVHILHHEEKAILMGGVGVVRLVRVGVIGVGMKAMGDEDGKGEVEVTEHNAIMPR